MSGWITRVEIELACRHLKISCAFAYSLKLGQRAIRINLESLLHNCMRFSVFPRRPNYAAQ
jgi:hypothetical protein